MMADPRLVKYAQALVDFSAPVKAGDLVAIQASTVAEPLVREVFAACLRHGAHPSLFINFPEQEELFFRLASDAQLAHVSPIEQLMMDRFDCRISLRTQINSRALTSVAPERIAKAGAASKPLMDTFMRRQAAGELAWTVAVYPTSAAAQDAEMSLHDYTEFVYDACKLNEPDPVAAWREQGVFQQRLIDWLQGKSDIHIVAPGTDLRVTITDRVWVNCDGLNNFPDGEIFTGPIETSAEGHVSFSWPAVRGGREVEGISLEFAQGKVVKASATKNEDYLRQMLDQDAGARFLGEFAFGTNYGIQRFTRNTLFDEKIGGTMHMALGAGYPETGSLNQSALHWDMVCDLRRNAEVRVDGQLFLRDGQFLV